jgi:hypothetical protein
MAVFHPPRHIVWSTDQLDLSDPFQCRWYLRQVLLHGRAEDIRQLDLSEVERELDDLQLPDHLTRLWKRFLEQRVAR